jgi:hypothetical protein
MSITVIIYYILASFNLVYELPDNGQNYMPKHVAVIKGCNILCTISAFSWIL